MLRSAVSVLISYVLLLQPVAVASSGDGKLALTIENLMRGPGLVGTEPTQVRWSGDGSTVYFQWKKASDPVNAPPDTYRANRDGSGLRKLSQDEAHDAPPLFVDTNRDHTLIVFSQDGDIVLIESATGKRRQLMKTSEAETNPRFLPDGRHITFQRGLNLFRLSLDKGDLEQLTDIRPPATPGSQTAMSGAGAGGVTQRAQAATSPATTDPDALPKGTDSQEYLKKEQAELFETVRDREKLEKENAERRKELNPRKPYTLQARQSLTQMQLSPDGNFVLAVAVTPVANAKPDNVPSWITDSSFPEEIPGRRRVGDDQGQRHLTLINVVTGELKTVDHGDLGTPWAEIEDGGACGGRGGGSGTALPPPVVSFSDDGSKGVFTARAQNNKSCWILALEPKSAKARALFKDEDPAWVGGPGGGQGWLGDNETFYFTSEKDGFNHLYEIPFSGGPFKQLTSGKFEIDRVELSRDKSKFYLTSSQGSNYAERNLWALNVTGGEATRITKAVGMHTATLSPHDEWIADVYSYTNKPPELYIQQNKPQAPAIKVTASPAPEFSTYAWIDPPIVKVRASDGAEIPGHLYKPAHFRKGGPAVIFVHGAGYLQNVHKGWSSSYYHEYLFHHFLMDHGYVVLDIDYRGSKGYGRDWRTAIYRHMGGKDLDDHIDAAKWLASQQGVDPKRIGIYGGSYGGFITLMAMFTKPDVFAAGAALRPVSDWALYNHAYTGNILNFPQKDAEAYRQSSPIFFADRLKGALLICHGMVDTNVHFVDTVRLTQRLIELHKDNWELAVYPVEDHAFKQSASWTDEYKRIYKLFETNLKK
ncbi:MAG: prolyl oligopeptidase family serine peptidase [Bryobacteraceae bacterium]